MAKLIRAQFGEGDRNEAETELADLFAASQGVADMLGRRRLLLELDAKLGAKHGLHGTGPGTRPALAMAGGNSSLSSAVAPVMTVRQWTPEQHAMGLAYLEGHARCYSLEWERSDVSAWKARIQSPAPYVADWFTLKVVQVSTREWSWAVVRVKSGEGVTVARGRSESFSSAKMDAVQAASSRGLRFGESRCVWKSSDDLRESMRYAAAWWLRRAGQTALKYAVGGPADQVSPVIPAVTFEEAVADLASRTPRWGPRLTANAKKVAELYSRQHAFALAKSTSLKVTERVQKLLFDAIKKGKPAPKVIDAIAKLGDWSKAYACFLPGTLVEGDILAGSQARYNGPAVEVETDDGRRLRVTVNHPVLTTRGWKDAGSLQEGDDLVCYGPVVESLDVSGCPSGSVNHLAQDFGKAVDHKDAPSRVEDVFETLLRQAHPRLHAHGPVSSMDFHGDAAFFQGEVHRVGTDSLLPLAGDPPSVERGREFKFVFGDLSSARIALPTSGSLDLVLQGSWLPSECGVGVLDPSFDLDFSSACPVDERPLYQPRFGHAANVYATRDENLLDVGRGGVKLCGKVPQSLPCLVSEDDRVDVKTSLNVGGVSYLNTPGLQKLLDPVSVNSALAGNLRHACPGRISTHRVVCVKRFGWAGHVYDLQTRTGWIVSHGIVTSNSTVYRTNLTSAYSAGRFAQARDPEVKEMFPALRRDSVCDVDTRPNHCAADGVIAPVDSPLWHYVGGAWGFNCRCSEESVDRDDLKRHRLIAKDGSILIYVPGRGRFSDANQAIAALKSIGAFPDKGFGMGRPDLRLHGVRAL